MPGYLISDSMEDLLSFGRFGHALQLLHVVHGLHFLLELPPEVILLLQIFVQLKLRIRRKLLTSRDYQIIS